MKTVELIYFAGCPNAEAARRNLRTALTNLGLPPTWIEWDQEQEGTPARVRGYGSPTVLADGRDVTETEAGGSSTMACRVDGAPSVTVIQAALREVEL